MNRRTFLGTAAAAGAAAMVAAPARAQARYKACVIGDTKHGGYGHDLHMVFGHRKDVAVVGLADPDEAGRQQRAGECGAARTYADYREMLEKEQPDFVTIGPRTVTNHLAYIEACAAVGAHGILEKPLAGDLASADAMIAAIEAKNLKWAIAHNFRVTKAIEHVKEHVIDGKMLGEVLEMRGRGKEDARAGGEDLMVLGTHVFDLMHFFAGKPRWCTADITVEGRPAEPGDVREGTEPIGPIVGDRIQAMYGFEQGPVGYFASVKTPKGNRGRWGLDLYCNDGVVTIRQDAPPTLALWQSPAWALRHDGPGWEPFPDAPDQDIRMPATERYAPIVDDLIEAAEADRRPAVSVQDARVTLECIQGVYAAYVAGARVALPLAEREHPLATWA